MKRVSLKNISMRGKISIIVILLFLIITGVVAYFVTKCPIVFKEESVKVEINEDFDAVKNILEVKNGKIKDVKINTKDVNYNKLGKYTIVYTYDDKDYEVSVEVVDTKKPKFEIIDLDLDVGMKIDPKSMVKNIEDATKTTVKFKEDYQFDKEGEITVVVQVVDEAGNISEKKAKVKLVKDKTAPEINGISELTVAKGGKPDYNSGVSVTDNRDPNPKLDIDNSKVDINKLGTYKAIYIATDRSGNKTKKERVIKVVEKKDIGTSQQSNEKIVYLTLMMVLLLIPKRYWKY